MRLMLLCTITTRLPIVIVRIAITTSAFVTADCNVWDAPALRANGMAAKVSMNTREKDANAAAFEPVERNAVTGVGAPSYTSGDHTWNGALAILKPKPTSIIAAPASSIGPENSCPGDAIRSLISWRFVVATGLAAGLNVAP